MNYYPHHIGDYSKDTAHLSMLEDAAYRRMLDVYYGTEKPLPLDQQKIYRLVRARSHAEKLAVDVVLGEFFGEYPDGWHNTRADVEIDRAKDKAGKAKASADVRWSKSGRNANASDAAMRTHSEGNAPNNQEPITKNQKRAGRGSRLPAGWEPSEILRAWAVKERPDLDQRVTEERFRNHWIAAPGSKGLKSDWEATFRNWVLGERAGAKAAVPDYSSLQDRLQDGA